MFMLGWVLVALGFGECYVADEIYADTARKKVAREVCKKVLDHDNIMSFTSYETKVEGKSALTNQTVLFYGNGSFTVDLDDLVSLSYTTKGDDKFYRSVTVYFQLEANHTGTVTLVRNKTWYDGLTM